MASTIEFLEYVLDQIDVKDMVTYKKMFGEYGIYYNGKIIGLICDNQFYVKKTKIGEQILGSKATEGPPYKGAKPQFVVDFLEDTELLRLFIEKSYEELPMQKIKKK